MKAPDEVLLDQLVAAFHRFGILMFTITLFCAFLLSNMYIDHFSIDERQILMGPKLQMDLKKRLVILEDQLRDKPADLELLKDISKTIVNIQRIDNVIKNYKLREVNIPLLGLSMPSGDVDIIIGIFLIALMGWALFSVKQIESALDDDEGKPNIAKYLPALRYTAFLASPPKSSRFVTCIAWGMILLPLVTMLTALVVDWLSIMTAESPKHIWSCFSTEQWIRTGVLIFILVLLFISSLGLCLARKRLVDLLEAGSE